MHWGLRRVAPAFLTELFTEAVGIFPASVRRGVLRVAAGGSDACLQLRRKLSGVLHGWLPGGFYAALSAPSGAPVPTRRRTMPPGAQPARLPARLQPELATLVDAPPPGRWMYEIKFDGYRLLARLASPRRVQLFTRNGLDWTQRFPALAQALRDSGLPPGWYDGEIVMPDANGRPSFHALQNAIGGPENARIAYYLFDAPYMDGLDLRRVPVEERRAILQSRLRENERLRFSQVLEADVHGLLRSACDIGLEGLIGKRMGSAYQDGRRSDDWIKLKCVQRQEFVIGGFTTQEGSGLGIGALLVGTFDEAGVLHYAGKVGTGFTGEEMTRLRQRLRTLAQPVRPFDSATGLDRRATWVRPELVCEVAYSEWPEGRQLRHPAYKGLRDDKPARAIERVRPQERPRQAAEPALPAQATRRTAVAPATHPASFQPTHPQRVIDASTGSTKLDLFRYYEEVSARMVPHLRGRLVYLLRAPQGLSAPSFFQRHAGAMKGLKPADPTLWPGHAPGIAIDTPADLLAAVQVGAIEFHVRNTRGSGERADRVVFDLDPGEGVGWDEMKEAATLLRTLLHELGLRSWLKTSGGKGLHVVVPCRPELPVETVRDWSQAVVQHMARTIPQRFVARPGASRRVGRIFIDWLRNAREQSTVAAYSARARPGLGVSMPLPWEGLETLASADAWDIVSAPEHLHAQQADPWASLLASRQSLRGAVGRLVR